MIQNLVQDLEELNHSITSCVVKWKTGYDAGGYEDFMRSLERLHSTLGNHFDVLQPNIEPLLATLKNLYQRIEDKDIIAVSDIMEYDLQPLVYEWRKRCEPE